jgi:hemolysin III
MRIGQLLSADGEELAEHYPTPAEHFADFAVHLVGLIAALIGGGILFVLALMHGGVPKAAAVALYAFGLLAMLGCSAVYNLTRPSPARRILRRLDEAAIFVMIAGSYTPFTTHALEGWLGPSMTTLVWGIALAGAAGKLFLPNISERLWCLVYIGYGWLALAIFVPLVETLHWSVMTLLAAGGVVYTVGVIFFLWPNLPFRRAIWHSFVVTGAALHFAAITAGVVLIGP